MSMRLAGRIARGRMGGMPATSAATRHPLTRHSGVPAAALALVVVIIAGLALRSGREGAVVTAPQVVPILMYHHVGDWGPAGDWAPWVVKPEDFEAQLDWLVAHGFHAITLAELRAHRERGEPLPPRPVVLTFDDGWGEQMSIARRWLEPRGLHGVFFVYTGAIGAGGYLSWDELRALEANGHEVLSHTVGHPDLVQVPDSRLAAEMRDSRARLERELGHAVEVIAYPYGSHDGRVVKAAGDAGYRMAVIATGGNDTGAEPRLEVPRWKMEYGEPLERFVERLRGS